jgi:ATP-dependent DNA helicase RecQ
VSAGDSVDKGALLEALVKRFGLTDFRGHQREAVAGVLAGRDVLLTMPTGAGKSLTYQLPAVLLDGLTLVVSPLIALMKDQVDALGRKGIAATFVNSSIEGRERRMRLEACVRGEIDLLYVTPERFRSPVFRELLPALKVARLAVDEAHCISSWGHDFRPDYSRLSMYRELLGDPPTIALTATATPKVAQDIVRALRLRDPLVLRAGIERENLFLSATICATTEEKIDLVARRLDEIGGAGIVYGTLVRDLENLEIELRRRGRRVLVYHGRLSPEERRVFQEKFMASPDAIVLATNAFGMGVDKADIRFVIHYQVPRTLEAWAQEVGRAGRDGLPSWCELLYFEEDLAIQQNFVRWANPSLEYLLGVYEVLRGWGERLQARDLDDLRQELLVKERRDNRVSISLKWLEVLGVTAGSFETHDLRLVRELDPDELPESVGSQLKNEHDLRALLGMAHFAREFDEPRRVLLARHFDLPQEDLAFGCDNSEDGDAWRAKNMPTRPAAEAADASSEAPPEPQLSQGDAPFQRGDWVRIDGRHLGQVVRVDGRGKRVKLVVESASDLRRRTVDPRRQRVERLEEQ